MLTYTLALTKQQWTEFDLVDKYTDILVVFYLFANGD